MDDNKMAEVAALFNKKLYEEFEVELPQGVYFARFTYSGVQCFSYINDKWKDNEYLLADLIRGYIHIVTDEEREKFLKIFQRKRE